MTKLNEFLKEEFLKDFLISEEKRVHKNIAEVLSYLMKDLDMSEGELSRRTGVPQPTINRIVSGKTPRPHRGNLEKLAIFFGISVDQLFARTPLSENRIKGTFEQVGATSPTIPVLNWRQLILYLKGLKFESVNSISIEQGLNPKAFALLVDREHASLEFKEGGLLIFDPQKLPKNRDYVLMLQSEQIYFGELIFLGAKRQIISEKLVIELDSNCLFGGVLVEFRRSFLN